MEEGKCNSFIHEIKNQIVLLRNRETFFPHQVLCSFLNSLSSSGTPRSIQQQEDFDETHCCLQAQFTNAPYSLGSCKWLLPAQVMSVPWLPCAFPLYTGNALAANWKLESIHTYLKVDVLLRKEEK